MLLEEVRESAWFLLIGEKPILYADCGQSGMIQQLNISPTMLRLSGISELVLLRWHPELVPALPIALPPRANLRVAGWRIASLPRIVN